MGHSDLVDSLDPQGGCGCSPRPSARRFWHGFAVRSACADGRAECDIEGTLRNDRGRRTRFSDLRGMARKAPEATTFFTERTLADYLAVSDRTIRNWIRRGELPSYKLGAARRIDPVDVDAFLASRRDEVV